MKYPMLTAITALLYAGVVHAVDSAAEVASSVTTRSSSPVPFEQVDTNHDGMISRDEAKIDTNLFRDFDKFNVSHTGMLDRSEYQVYLQSRQSRVQ